MTRIFKTFFFFFLILKGGNDGIIVGFKDKINNWNRMKNASKYIKTLERWNQDVQSPLKVIHVKNNLVDSATFTP